MFLFNKHNYQYYLTRHQLRRAHSSGERSQMRSDAEISDKYPEKITRTLFNSNYMLQEMILMKGTRHEVSCIVAFPIGLHTDNIYAYLMSKDNYTNVGLIQSDQYIRFKVNSFAVTPEVNLPHFHNIEYNGAYIAAKQSGLIDRICEFIRQNAGFFEAANMINSKNLGEDITVREKLYHKIENFNKATNQAIARYN